MPHTQMMEERLRFLDIDGNAVAELRNAKDILESAMDEMLDRFYSHILREPDLRALFVDEDAIARARSGQKNHWL
ncbi:MAG: protoglobin domain-containing protein, partial [Gammaproteobacteria bacterium]|nr:protoglobin domain-containing protein [Gammaproteobacteria bacterium]